MKEVVFTELPDGSALMSLEMTYEEMKVFASIGFLQTLKNSVEQFEDDLEDALEKAAKVAATAKPVVIQKKKASKAKKPASKKPVAKKKVSTRGKC